MKFTILTFVDYYLPGFKAGGPLRALSRLIDVLGGKADFRVVTGDRDLGDDAPYQDVLTDRWQRVGAADVLYASPGTRSLKTLRRWLVNERYDLLYLNSIFSRTTVRILMLRGLRLVPQKPLVIAPRGEFDRGALAVRWGRKRLYLAVLKLLRACDGAVWQASSAHEVDDIHACWSSAERRVHVELTPELVTPPTTTAVRRASKRSGELSCVFLARVCRVKNLHGVLAALRHVQAQVTLDIYGPLEDTDYWRECEAMMRELPPSIRAVYRGIAQHDDVAAVLAAHQLYLLPTFGENFGHGIIEALSMGCPAIVGTRTPWHDLDAARAGRVVDPTNLHALASAITKFARMDEPEYASWSASARLYAARLAHDEQALEANRQLFVREPWKAAG